MVLIGATFSNFAQQRGFDTYEVSSFPSNAVLIGTRRSSMSRPATRFECTRVDTDRIKLVSRFRSRYVFLEMRFSTGAFVETV